ncbi:MAG: hypothetical protein ACKOCO_01300, partial [Bacteroidota bacterium]
MQPAHTTKTKAADFTAVPREKLEKAFVLMATSKSMTELYEDNFKFVSRYVHATSRGHEAIQLA